MKHNILISLVMVSLLMGQDEGPPLTSSATINVSANVVGAIEMVTLQNLDIGVVTPSMEYININPGEDAGAALIQFAGGSNLGVRIVFSQTVIMVSEDGSTLCKSFKSFGLFI